MGTSRVLTATMWECVGVKKSRSRILQGANVWSGWSWHLLQAGLRASQRCLPGFHGQRQAHHLGLHAPPCHEVS